jgi:hypothetical protein
MADSVASNGAMAGRNMKYLQSSQELLDTESPYS